MSDIRDNRQTAMLFLHAQTPLHPGSGTALGVVDLPVQRERHTQWPLIPGSSLKGVLRDACRETAKHRYNDEYDDKPEGRRLRRTRRQVANEDDELLTAAFGPGKVNEGSAHAGALSVTDARILAFPVRSLRGVFAWVTCPAVLERFNRDAALVRSPQQELDQAPAKGKALCSDDSPLVVDGNQLVLEEFTFERSGDAIAVSRGLADQAFLETDTATPKMFRQRLAILHDDDFTHFARHATEVVARIGLDHNTKTVKTGALFYQEFLPTETLFYALVFANPSRRDQTQDATAILGYLTANLPEVLQIGGDETTGRGLCAVRLSRGKEGE